jgi:hypothetical protein
MLHYGKKATKSAFGRIASDWRPNVHSQLLQKRLSGDDAHSGGDAQRNRPGDSELPIPGYDRIHDKRLIAELSKHSQAELTAIATYERSHKNRPPVFDKLRYLRGQEPIEGYDDLSAEEILVMLEAANGETLQRTRSYERKFQRRPDVLDEVGDAIRDRRRKRRPGSVHRDPPRVTAPLP